MARLKYWQAINQALREEMARDEAVCVLGEDVGAPGGPFGATKGLLDEFGAARVRDTPISEATIVGAALGASMTGLRPVVEVMFLDFMTVAMDQVVNQAAKVGYMSGGHYRAPMVVRTICASGRNTGPQHAQNLEAWLAHVPGLTVVWGSNPADARGLLKSAIRDDGPVVVIESLAEWSRRGEVADDPDALVPIGVAAVRRPGTDVTVVTWGGAVHRVDAAAAALADEVDVEVIDLRTISPWDRATVLESVRRTGRLVVVHDAVAAFGAGAEIAATVAEHCFGDLRAPVTRVAAPFAPSPFPPQLEAAYLPQPGTIADAIRASVLQGVR
ncbi:Pyruvate dehydrogenase (acetyl-transferring) [Pseudonocardia dioxanivorans CB1190]|uniref:Pyruvate dehydrogenase (Acetyl-transferring) n=1 Tax=Pseudonocardia dioxanivorans (strain ATCC 55486 / DSM 44775 / JCM 13855 / CB1190) TaxID=675635 RepID=F4CZ09_PSEUX|nr:alpha-ketoacid dehydrogenase subunit beta [Pseudonocardia dioxanivorans]AEA24300.1 Pyruvate dehydrogenase (acetyl-transferring) [Pseudonocardia dioxanivorans CB1190]